MINMSKEQSKNLINKMNPPTKKALTIISINLLFSMIGLFFYPFKHLVLILLLPWAGLLLSYVGSIPFAGFLIYYWIYTSVVMDMWWVGINGLHTSLYTTGIWMIYQVYSLLSTIRSTGTILPDIPVSDD